MEVEWEEILIPITHQQQNMDPASWKLTWEETLIPNTHQVDACSCRLTGEEITEICPSQRGEHFKAPC